MVEPSGSSATSNIIALTDDKLQEIIAKAVAQALPQDDSSDAESVENDPVERDSKLLLDSMPETTLDLSPALCKLVHVRLTDAMSPEVMGSKKQLYNKVPGNAAEFLTPTAVNLELWSTLPQFAKTKDKR